MARLLAVNVGLPREVVWRGNTVWTGIWKTTVTGRRTVRRLNIDGDGQGDLQGHGGEQRAVLVYQLASYRYWQDYFKRDDFTNGQFGENFTVDGLADDEVCIGDRYQIGTAVFEVTQPRVTCYRVGLRMGEPEMAALLISHRRPGFYLRVLTEGDVGAGDDIVKVGADPARISVADINALLYLPGHDRSRAAIAAAIPALSPGWKASLEALADRPQSSTAGNPGLSAASGPPPAWSGFRPLRVARVDTESVDVRSFHLAALDGEPLPPPRPGQFLTLRLRPQAQAGPALVRNYSLSGPIGAAWYRISVKREAMGAASTYLHTKVAEGTTLEVAAPRGTFVLDDDRGPIVLLSAGIGATPLLSMLHALVAARSPRRVWWLHAARDGLHHPFAREARELLGQLADARAHISFSEPGPSDKQGVDYTTAGRMTGQLLRDLGLPAAAHVYLCGPPAFMVDLTAAVTALGVDPVDVHREIFGAEPASAPGVVRRRRRGLRPTGGQSRAPSVSFARSGLTVPWDASYGSVLDLAEDFDVPTRWSCRTGVCHTCETGLLTGLVRYSPEPLDAPADGDLLICCAQPVDDITVDL